MALIYSILIFTLVLIWLPWIWRYKLSPRRAKADMSKLLQNHPQSLTIIKTHEFLHTLYHGIYADSTSKRERVRLKITDDAFVYGEIDFLSFLLILDRVQPQAGEIFYDLGSGAGKAVFAAGLRYDLGGARGIELLDGLYKLSLMQINKAKTLAKLMSPSEKKDLEQRLASIEFIQDNFLNRDISDGDIVFINATCLGYSTWQSLLEKLKLLKSGSRVIVTSKKIEDPSFAVLSQSRDLMSWGLNSVNIYQKV